MSENLVGKIFKRIDDNTKWKVHLVYQDIVYLRSLSRGATDCPTFSELNEEYIEEEAGTLC